jgi:lysophospholipase L1-like esterase
VLATRAPAPTTPAALAGAASADRVNVLWLGDSVAESLVALLREPAARGKLRLFSKARGACTSMPYDVMRLAGGRVMIGDFCPAAREAWFAAEPGFTPDLVVLIEGFAGIGDRRIDGRWLHPCDAAYDARYAAELERVVERLARDVGPVVLATMPPLNALRATEVVLGGPGVDRARLVAVAVQRMHCQNAVRRTVARRSGARLIDLAERVCPAGRCPRADDGAAPRRDGLHFAGAGGQAVAAWLAEQLGALARAAPR